MTSGVGSAFPTRWSWKEPEDFSYRCRTRWISRISPWRWVCHRYWSRGCVGCLNHALLTQEAIHARGLRPAGWVANRIDPDMAAFDENLAALTARLRAPRLAIVPYLERPADTPVTIDWPSDV
jgi:hypothetical protein